MALPPEIANFDYKSVLFGPDYVHNVVVGLTVTFMSFLAYAILRLATPYLAGFFRGLAFILCLSVFLFLGLIAVRIGGPGPAPAIVLPPMNQLPAWPAPLTKDEIVVWGDSLSSYHPSSVIITLVNDQQVPFVRCVAQALRQAKWPPPSIQPNNFAVGVRIVVGRDADDMGKAVRQLIEKKLGATVDYDTATGGTFPAQGISIQVGWPPP